MGKKFSYYNNGIKQIAVYDETQVPEGFKKGGLPKSQEHKDKIKLALKGKPKSAEHRLKNSLSHKGRKHKKRSSDLSPERRQAISMQMRNSRWVNNGEEELKIDISQMESYCQIGYVPGRLKFDIEARQRMSEAKKGKTSWAKGKKFDRPKNTGKHWYTNGLVRKMIKPGEEIPEGFYAGTPHPSAESIALMKEKAQLRVAKESSEQRQNRINKILETKKKNGTLCSSTPQSMEKRWDTLKNNNSFNRSLPEDYYYGYLINLYGEDDVIRQYKDERYPFSCDFYIKSQDLFIELNGTWTHGIKPFDQNDPECQEILSKWEIKAQTSKFYKNAIYVWTELDVKKRKCALENKLNFEWLKYKERTHQYEFSNSVIIQKETNKKNE